VTNHAFLGRIASVLKGYSCKEFQTPRVPNECSVWTAGQTAVTCYLVFALRLTSTHLFVKGARENKCIKTQHAARLQKIRQRAVLAARCGHHVFSPLSLPRGPMPAPPNGAPYRYYRGADAPQVTS
jgi:hypothetical protein